MAQTVKTVSDGHHNGKRDHCESTVNSAGLRVVFHKLARTPRSVPAG